MKVLTFVWVRYMKRLRDGGWGVWGQQEVTRSGDHANRNAANGGPDAECGHIFDDPQHSG